jgi:hypothetical protein
VCWQKKKKNKVLGMQKQDIPSKKRRLETTPGEDEGSASKADNNTNANVLTEAQIDAIVNTWFTGLYSRVRL